MIHQLKIQDLNRQVQLTKTQIFPISQLKCVNILCSTCSIDSDQVKKIQSNIVM